MNEEIEIPPEFQDLMNFNGIYNDMNNKKTSYFVSSLYRIGFSFVPLIDNVFYDSKWSKK